MKSMVALIISLLVESVKSGLPNKSVLTNEFPFSAKILGLTPFCLPLSGKICAMDKEMSY